MNGFFILKKINLSFFVGVFWVLNIFASPNEINNGDGQVSQLLNDLKQIKLINQKVHDTLPVIYNYSLIVGYINMPSARVGNTGMTALGFSYVPPYHIYSLNFQMFGYIELVGNYRVYKGLLEQGFGHAGYGDDADRGANVKFVLYKEDEGLKFLPSFALGFEDFYGSRRFKSFYVAATKEFKKQNLELTLGWGKGRLKGFYGGIAWTPFRFSDVSIFNKTTLLLEYDAYNYKHHTHEHPKGTEVKYPINFGVTASFFDFLQLKVSSLRGQEIAASAVLTYNLGESKGFFAKTQNPNYYTAPIDTEPLGYLRTEKEFARELAMALCRQGLYLYKAYLQFNENSEKTLWLKIYNTRYRVEKQVRSRLEYLLSSIIPSDVVSTVVVMETDGIPTQAYFFQTKALLNFLNKEISEEELSVLSPLMEAAPEPNDYESILLYRRKKDTWTFTLRPRLLTFFGSTTGKIKYSVGFVAGPEGYLFDAIYYKLQAAYNIKSSMSDLGDRDVYNTSHLPIVRSDSLKYFSSNSVQVEQMYIQKGYNLSRGWFTKWALGYFEPAYGGIASELLYYPVHSSFAFGIEGAGVLKRDYRGLGLTTKIKKYNQDNTFKYIHFIGYQYFFNIYYEYKPWHLDFKISIGSFLARDKGINFQLTRYYPSGLRFSIWYTITNANDRVNGKRYDDKGIAFYIPFDLFLKKSSQTMLGYAMSEWLRDVGAVAATGNRLYPTIQVERQQMGQF